MELQARRKDEIKSEMLKNLMTEMKAGSGRKLHPVAAEIEVVHENPQDEPLEFEAPGHDIDESSKDAHEPIMDAASEEQEEHDISPGLAAALGEAHEASQEGKQEHEEGHESPEVADEAAHEERPLDHLPKGGGVRNRLDKRMKRK